MFKNQLFSLFSKSQKKKFILLVFFMFIASLFEMISLGLIIPILGLFLNSSKVIENIYIEKILFYLNINNEKLFFYLIFLFLLIYLIKIALLIFITWYEQRFLATFKEKLSANLFYNYIKQNFSFFLGKNSSEIFRKTILDIDVVTLFLQGFLRVLLELLTILFLTTLLFFVNVKMAFSAILIFLIVSFLFLKMTRPAIKKLGEERMVNTSKRLQFLQEGIGAVKDIKLLGRESFFYENFQKHNIKLSSITLKWGFISNLPRHILELTAVTTIVSAVLLLNIFQIEFSEIVTILALYIAAAFKIMPSANRIVNSLQQIKFSYPAVKTVVEEMKKFKIKKKEENNFDQKFSFKNELVVDIKDYKYKNDRGFRLKDINFRIKKGDKIGIIGPSGAGKSTLIELLLGILKPDNGDIKIDGKSIFLNSENWQKLIGYIPQKIFILDNTLRNNILFGLENEKYNDDKLIELIKKVNLSKLLTRLPKGLDHRLGERGIDLSGGEIQRIGIARACIYNPEMIFFDEATSSLDTFTEKKILNEMENFKDKTFISVAHRINTLKNCDKIYRLDKGTIIDSGNFEKFNNF